MPETTLFPEVESPSVVPVIPVVSRGRRLLALGIVLSVSFAHFIASAFYSLFQTEKSMQRYSQFGVFSSLLAEILSLLLLWFVLSEHKRSWAEIGWTPHRTDLIHGGLLIAASSAVYRIATILVQGIFRSFAGHYLQARSVHGVTGAGLSVLTVLFVLLNPFFEELIVRGYTMSEVVGLGGSRNLAILVSVLIQMSYHIYQGLLRCIGVTAIFLVFSIYFSRTRRIAPLIVAHCWTDVWALIRVSF